MSVLLHTVESASMSRSLVVLLLLCLLPLQFVWAAAAPYCGHEGRAPQTAQHIGHHEHQHQGGAVAPDSGGDDSGGMVSYHGDCGSCHLGTTTSVPPAAMALAVGSNDRILSDHSARYQSHIPFGPERPDRS